MHVVMSSTMDIVPLPSFSSSPLSSCSPPVSPPLPSCDPFRSMNDRAAKRKAKKQSKMSARRVSKGIGNADDLKQVLGMCISPGILLKLDGRLNNSSGNSKKRKISCAEDKEGEQKSSSPPLHMKDIRELVLWCLTESVISPRWIFIKNRPLIKRLVLVVCESLGASYALTEIGKQNMPNLSSIIKLANVQQQSMNNEMNVNNSCNNSDNGNIDISNNNVDDTIGNNNSVYNQYPCCLKSPGFGNNVFDPVMEFLKCEKEKSKSAIKKLKKDACIGMNQTPTKEHLEKVDRVPAYEFLLSMKELEVAGFPLSIEQCTAKGNGMIYVQTSKHATNSTPVYSMLALDCEMVKTSRGRFDIARVTLVDSEERVVLDSYCIPDDHVVDYVTAFSGISKELLRNVTTTFLELRQQFLSYVSSDTILVGHSLENDLHSLGIVHSLIIDTSLLYPHPAGPPCRIALRKLSEHYLNMKIQLSESGHNSVEDAIAALRLVHLKMIHGHQFGLFTSMGSHNLSVEYESLFSVLSRNGVSSSMIGVADVLRQHIDDSASAFVVAHAMEAASKTVALIEKDYGNQCQFVMTCLSDVRMSYCEETVFKCDTFPLIASTKTQCAVERVDHALRIIMDGVSKDNMLIVMLPQETPIPLRMLGKARTEKIAKGQVLDTSEDESLRNLVSATKQGVAIFLVKS